MFGEPEIGVEHYTQVLEGPQDWDSVLRSNKVWRLVGPLPD